MNKYDILDVIDQGAYGIVLKGLNRETGAIVAIKKFKETDEDEVIRKSIQRQIKMLKALRSDYIIDLKEAFKKKGKVYLIFEHMERNVLNLIEETQTGLQSNQIAEIVYQTIKAIDFLHNKNIIHRDIKPENLLINRSNGVFKLKMCDFGFTRTLPSNKDQDMTDYVATRWYRSPELLVGQPYGKPVDIWALGCIIGELIDGQPMFAGQNEMDQIHLIRKVFGKLDDSQENILKTNPRFEKVRFPQVKYPQPLQMKYVGKIQKNELSFLKACLKLNPNQRITTMDALKHPYLLPFVLRDEKLKTQQYHRTSMRKMPQIRHQSQERMNMRKNTLPIPAPIDVMEMHKLSIKNTKKSELKNDSQLRKSNDDKLVDINKPIKLSMNLNLNVNLNLNIDKALPKIKETLNTKSNSQPMMIPNKLHTKIPVKTIYNQNTFDFEVTGKSQSINKFRKL